MSGREKLLLVGLVGVTIGAFGVEQTHQGQTEIIALVFVALPLVLAGLVFARLRWMPAVAAAVAAIFILGAVLTAGEAVLPDPSCGHLGVRGDRRRTAQLCAGLVRWHRGDRAAVPDLQEHQEEWLTIMSLRRCGNFLPPAMR